MAPDSKGTITILMKNVGPYQYLSGFAVAEVTTASKIAVDEGTGSQTDLAEPLKGININMSPSKELQIVSNSFSGAGVLSIQDAGGRMVYIRKINIGPGSTFGLPLLALKKGTYTIKFVTSSGVVEESINL